MGSKKDILLISGDLSENSLLRQQLQLESVFEFRIQNQPPYLNSVENTIPKSSLLCPFYKINFLKNQPNIRDLIHVLDQSDKDWKNSGFVMIYPAAIYFRKFQNLDILIQKLLALDIEVHLKTRGLPILKLSTERIISMPPTSLLYDLNDLDVQTLREEVVDL